MADVSGLYTWSQGGGTQIRADVRLDVDGRYPQMAASGTRMNGSVLQSHWVANLTAAGPDTWTGTVVYNNPQPIPYSTLTFQVSGTTLKVTFHAQPGVPEMVREYQFVSPFFHEVAIEYDTVEGATTTLDYNLHAHPNRPASLPNETVTLDNIFERAGFRVTNTGGNSSVPLSLAGSDGFWTDAELHDAMEAHFSRFLNQPQWVFWTVFATRYIGDVQDPGTSTGGIMFDYTGARQRQGTAIFTQATMLSQTSGPNAAEWTRRMQFWCAAHEMGHAFNLVHAWDKGGGGGWVPLQSSYNLLSFMNYPFKYQLQSVPGLSGDERSRRYFRDFEFRFSDAELRFLRHAPEWFVEMGGETWASNHGFVEHDPAEFPQFELIVRTNKTPPAGKPPAFAYLEPVVLELKLRNASDGPVVVSAGALKDSHELSVIVKKDGGEFRQWKPFAPRCVSGTPVVLQPDEAIYASLFGAVGLDGWLMADPGNYTLQAAVEVNGTTVVSQPARVRILPPNDRAEEVIGQDLFTDEVGRVLAFDGTRTLTTARNTLAEVAAKFPDHPAAVHANVALGMPLIREFKQVTPADGKAAARGKALAERVVVHKAELKEGIEHLEAALGKGADADAAAATLGHIDYATYAVAANEALAEHGKKAQAQTGWKQLRDTLAKRGVLPRVLEAIEEHEPAPGAPVEANGAEGNGQAKAGARKAKTK